MFVCEKSAPFVPEMENWLSVRDWFPVFITVNGSVEVPPSAVDGNVREFEVDTMEPLSILYTVAVPDSVCAAKPPASVAVKPVQVQAGSPRLSGTDIRVPSCQFPLPFKSCRICMLGLSRTMARLSPSNMAIPRGSLPTGKLTGDAKLQAEGKMDKAKGAVHNAVGDVKEETRSAVNSRPGSGSGS